MLKIGFRGRAIFVSLVVFIVIGAISLFLIYQFARSTALSLGKEYALERVMNSKEQLSNTLALNLRLAQKVTSSLLLKTWMKDETNEAAKSRAFRLMCDSADVAQTDSWFVATSESRHYYFNDKQQRFLGKELLKTLDPLMTDDAWFFHMLSSNERYNFNPDYDSAVNATKLWLNMVVMDEGKPLGVAGFGIDFRAFIDEYVALDKEGFESMIITPQGAIIGHSDLSLVTYNMRTTDPKEWKTIWNMIDSSYLSSLKPLIEGLALEKSQTAIFEISINQKRFVVAAAYVPHVDLIALSMVNIDHLIGLKDMVPSLLVFSLLAILTAVVAFWLTNYYLLIPLSRLTNVSKEVSKGNYAVRITQGLEGSDEMAHLCRLVNSMIEQMQTSSLSTQERYQWVAENTHDVIWVMDTKGKFVYVSPSVENLRGFSASEVMQQSIEEVICPNSLCVVQEAMARAINSAKEGKTPSSQTVFVEQPCKNGTTVWTEVSSRLVVNPDDGTMQFIGSSRDITQRLKAEEEIQKLAFYDPLTNLANRRLLFDRMEKALLTCRRTKSCGALFFLDLDEFKPLNDTYGHAIGDELLCEVAKRLQGTIRSIDTVARFGGDEFVILLGDLGLCKMEAREATKMVADKLSEILSLPYVLSEVTYSLSASIGATVFGEDTPLDVDALLDEADNAMYQAKEMGKDCVVIKG